MTKPLKVALYGGRAQEKSCQHGGDVENWTQNGIFEPWVKKWDRVFNIHTLRVLREQAEWRLYEDILWALRNPTVPLYTADAWKNIKVKGTDKTTIVKSLPNQKIFPLKELLKMPRGDYHCGSFDWLVAYAIHLGAKEIYLYGIILRGGEPLSAAACLEYWCGYATGLGIKIICGSDCDLFYYYHWVRSRRLYGYDKCEIIENEERKLRFGLKGAPK